MANEQLPNDLPEKKQQDETTGTESIVRQHMEDQHHVITEEEMRNVEVGKFEENQEYEGELAADGDIDDIEEGDNREHTPPNPWDVKE